MKWTYSSSRIFVKCQKMWYFHTNYANSRSKNQLRKQAFQLKQLQSISAWRGSLVDKTIERTMISYINKNEHPRKSEILEFAHDLLDRQLEFGMKQKHKDTSMVKSKTGDEYCAFYDLEYKGSLDQKAVDFAKSEVTTALNNILNSKLLEKLILEENYSVSQRSISYTLDSDIHVNATPDLISFSKKSISIIDWKVHAFATARARKQLGIYALVLLNQNPHKDYPENFNDIRKQNENIKLIEYQLLQNKLRKYEITQEDLHEFEDYIYLSALKMKRVLKEQEKGELPGSHFESARSTNVCTSCRFKAICWDQVRINKSKGEGDGS